MVSLSAQSESEKDAHCLKLHPVFLVAVPLHIQTELWRGRYGATASFTVLGDFRRNQENKKFCKKCSHLMIPD